MDDSFAAALTRAQTVTIQVENIQQAEEHITQAHGAMLPNIQGNAKYGQQENPPGQTATAQEFNPANQSTVWISAAQPLFRGFRDFATLRQDQDLTNASKLDRDAAVVQLYKDVTQAFYNVLVAESDLIDIRMEMRLFDTRIKELQKFQRIGRSRLSEVLTAQSSLASLKATESQTMGQVEGARQVMVVLTGFDVRTPFTDPRPDNSAPPEALTAGLGKIDVRPEVVAADVRVKSAVEGIDIARGQHWPSVDLTGDYYFQRPGLDKNIHWDVGLQATIPIYSGGIIQSQVAEAVSKKRQGDDQREQARQQAEQEVRTLHDQVAADLAQISDLDNATTLAKKSFEDLTREYRLGLVTNLDVLTAMQAYEESARALDHTRVTLRSDRERYAAATMTRPAGFQLSAKP